MSNIEGIPEGWELVRVGKAMMGDHWLNDDGLIMKWDHAHRSAASNYPIIRKIPKPKQYRPFANAAEFEPHRDRWFKQKSGRVDHRVKTHSYNDRKHYTGEDGDTWQTMFNDFEFEDGSPFGVEVTL